MKIYVNGSDVTSSVEFGSVQITEQLNNVYANQSEKGRRDDRRLIEAFKRKFSEATEGTW